MKNQTRIIQAGIFGNLVESFDMVICGLLSVYIAKYLIGDDAKGVFIVFLTLFAGYLARPLGAILMGLLSDIYGRKLILASSILSMGISTAMIGLIPPYSLIGIFSVISLLILRIIQSFSSGAELLNSSAYLVENAEAAKKGYSGSWATFGAMMGMLIASVVTLAVTYSTSYYPEYAWLIWRAPFIIAFFGTSIGLYIRLSVPESQEYIKLYTDKPKPQFKILMADSLSYIRNNKIQSLYAFALSCLGVITMFQIYIYGPMQAHLYQNFQDYQIIQSNIISLVVLLVIFPIVGRLSDKLDREKIVIWSSLGLLVLSQPYFYSLANSNIYELVLKHALIAIPAGAYYATVPVILAEMFPVNVRCTVLSILYSIAASLSAGLAPLISLLLVEKTKIPSSPSLLILIFVALSIIIIRLNSKETAGELEAVG